MFIFGMSIYTLSFWYAWGLFAIGLSGLIFYHRNLLFVLLNMELVLLGASFYFIIGSFSATGQIYALMILALAAAESAVGLSLFTVIFGFKNEISSESLATLRG